MKYSPIIVSGGQTGADYAGLCAAKVFGLRTAGWMPKGFKTLDGPRPEYAKLFGLKETESDRYPPRTFANVSMADFTIRFAGDFSTPGERLTQRACAEKRKPYNDCVYGDSVDHIIPFLSQVKPRIINIAGNAESTYPGIFKYTFDSLCEIFRQLRGY